MVILDLSCRHTKNAFVHCILHCYLDGNFIKISQTSSSYGVIGHRVLVLVPSANTSGFRQQRVGRSSGLLGSPTP